MKKFVILVNSGSWEQVDGKTVIDCTVKTTTVHSEYDEYSEARKAMQNLPTSERLPGGVWHSYSLEPRKRARKCLK